MIETSYADSRLGTVFMEKGLLPKEKVDAAVEEQKFSGKRLVDIIVEHAWAREDDLTRAIGQHFGVPYEDDPVSTVQPAAARRIPESLARKSLSVPLRASEDGLEVAMADPTHLFSLDDLSYVANCQILPRIATKTRILATIDLVYGDMDTITSLIDGIETDHVEVVGRESVDLAAMAAEIDAPMVKLVNFLLLEAIRQGASDVHIDPTRTLTRVRYRVDGILREVISPPKSVHPAVCTRIKVLSNLNIAERRLPQDGRSLIRTRDGSEVDIRVNVLPTIYGEKVGIRLLRQDTGGLDIRRLGMSPETVANFAKLIHRPSGMLLVVGPTGSGKTTTLYSALADIDSTAKHIITIEDPVEYRLDNVNQIQVNSKIGMTFSQGLRAVLRQDPDVVLIGEIRDKETADTAIEAALTGHLVFATLHSTDAAHTIARLNTLGVQSSLAANALIGIISTRLVRRLCVGCRTAAQVPEAWKSAGITAFKAVGCADCRQTGYRGRTGLYELAAVDDRMQAIIQHADSAHAIQEALLKLDFRSLWTDGSEKVQAGVTSFEEVMRVTRSFATGTGGD